MAAKRKRKLLEKRIDDTQYLAGKRRGGILKEEAWFEGETLAKYSFAFIDPQICSVDNGRVLGYDDAHGYHHRHFMGQVSLVTFVNYEVLAEQFIAEVQAIWREHGNG